MSRATVAMDERPDTGGPGAAVVHPYVEALLAGCQPTGGPAGFVDAHRARALESANSLNVPSVRDEEWRFTDIAPLTRLRFRPAGGRGLVTREDIARYFAPEASTRLVFVDGIYAPELSAAPQAAPGVAALPLASAFRDGGAGVERYLARLAGYDRDLFAAINTSHLRDGAYVAAAEGARDAVPVQVLHVATQRDIAIFPRCLVIAAAGSECALIEQFVSLADQAYFTNAVTEIAVGAGARVTHVRVQDEARGAYHLATCAVALDRDAAYEAHAVTLGARISRQHLGVIQQGEGADVGLNGLTMIGGRQLADTHTVMDHAGPNGRCRQVNKCIVGDAGHAVFGGKIIVRPGAQLTNSAQESRNLLLSDRARVDTKPQLEIFADDVKCAHGATVGQLDAEQLFYLRSRGLADRDARNLLTYAFGAEMIARIPVPSLAAALREAALTRTAGA